ncbi:HNH endonuclease signature motif containing protein, partial [Pasteurella multocida]|uniref:HNH endonuclease signature motif containing protein n=1 Tax=Pasteurella multocida TaxID=747 RepID=UPI002EB018DF|nr:HNH endonuclease signature motif containing protein [Pasteurella multocida]
RIVRIVRLGQGAMDQRRADALCDLALTGAPTDTALRGIRASVSIVIPATVLTGDDSGDDDARLRTGQLVDPETARLLAGMTKLWTRVFTHPVTGHVVAVDGYRPPRKLRALLRERDQRCRFPGCGAKAEHADLDHTIPWADGGTTTLGNLAHLCRRHHMLKGAILSGGRAWQVRQLGHGVLEWTTPDGRVYVDEPDSVG